jgi:hypothetical protein
MAIPSTAKAPRTITPPTAKLTSLTAKASRTVKA